MKSRPFKGLKPSWAPYCSFLVLSFPPVLLSLVSVNSQKDGFLVLPSRPICEVCGSSESAVLCFYSVTSVGCSSRVVNGTINKKERRGAFSSFISRWFKHYILLHDCHFLPLHWNIHTTFIRETCHFSHRPETELTEHNRCVFPLNSISLSLTACF